MNKYMKVITTTASAIGTFAAMMGGLYYGVNVNHYHTWKPSEWEKVEKQYAAERKKEEARKDLYTLVLRCADTNESGVLTLDEQARMWNKMGIDMPLIVQSDHYSRLDRQGHANWGNAPRFPEPTMSQLEKGIEGCIRK